MTESVYLNLDQHFSEPEVYGPDVYGPDDDEAEVFRNPNHLPPLHNTTSGMSILQWYRFEYWDDTDIDLAELGNPLTKTPSWAYHTDESLQTFLQQEIGGYSSRQDYPNIDWAMREGIAPGQPFLVRFDKPIVSGGSYEYPEDVDVEYPVHLVRVMPKSLVGAGKAWAHTLKRIEKIRERMLRQSCHYYRQAKQNKKWWRIHKDHMPSPGLKLKLLADIPGDAERTIHRIQHLAEGECKSGKDYRTAFDNLLQNFIQNYPDEDVAPVLALSEVPYSALDYLMLG